MRRALPWCLWRANCLKVERAFDAYNNVIGLKDHGRTDVSGDETWTVASFAPNTTAYIVSLPSSQTVHAGMDISFPYIGYDETYYEGNTGANATPPTKGNVTRTRSLSNYGSPQKEVNQYFAYDSYGNKISATNRLGHKTEWDYDATYHLYPIARRSPVILPRAARRRTRASSRLRPTTPCAGSRRRRPTSTA